MKIKAISPWFGAKRRLAKAIVQEFGDHETYWEPCCGALSVVLSKPPARWAETVADKHGDLVNLARVIQCRHLGPRFYRELRRVIAHEELFAESRRVIETEAGPGDDLNIDRAFHFFIYSWMGRQGVPGRRVSSNHFCAGYTRNGRRNVGKHFHAAVDSIPEWRKRMRSLTILMADLFDLLPRIGDDRGTVIYIDPPFIQKCGKYLHDFDEDDHEQLAKQVRRFRKARVVLSYDDAELIDELYPRRWTRRVFAENRLQSREKRAELLLINGPSFAESDQMVA